MAGVSVHNLVKSYGSVKVLQDVSFEAQDGEFIALVGPSGCGKSTLLRTIAGLEAVNGGTITIGGRVVKDRKSTRLNSSHSDLSRMPSSA